MLKHLMRKAIFFLAVNIVFIALCTPVMAETETEIPVDSHTLSDFMDDFFTNKMSEYHVPGAAIIVVKDGSVLFSKGYGYADIENGIPVDPQKTIFRATAVLGESDIYGGFPDESRWVEIEPLLFRRVDKERYMAFQADEEGEIISLASGSGYHGAFVKIPWYESNRIQLYLLMAYIAVFLAAIIVGAIQFAKGKRSPLQIGGIISLLFIIGLFGVIYALFLHRIAGFPAFAFGVSLLAKIMLTLLLAASVLSNRIVY